jgi:hypothetical protein
MKYSAATYTDFIKFNRKPNEDFYLASSRYTIFAVADGVTHGRFESGAYAFPTGALGQRPRFFVILFWNLWKKILIFPKKITIYLIKILL